MIKWNSRLSFALKLTVALLGLYFAYRSIDFTVVNIQISWRSVSFFLFAFVVNIVAVLVSAARLYVLSDMGMSYLETVKINFVGLFFNLFLPTIIGGDIARTVKCRKSSHSVIKSMSIIVIDRFVGLSSLIIMSVISLIVLNVYVGHKSSIIVESMIVVLFIGTVVLWIILFFSSVVDRILLVLEKMLAHSYSCRYIGDIIRSLHELRGIPLSRLLTAVIISFVYHLLCAFIMFLLSRVLDLDIEFFVFLVFGTITSVILMVPISIGGLGVRDMVYNVLYGSVTDSTAMPLLAPLSFVLMILIGAVGGVLFVVGDNKRNANNTDVSEFVSKV